MSKIALGINIGHDQGAAVVKDGILIGALAQERVNRIKHSASVQLPFAAIDVLLNYLNIDIHSVDCFGFSSLAVDIKDLERYIIDSLVNHYRIKWRLRSENTP